MTLVSHQTALRDIRVAFTHKMFPIHFIDALPRVAYQLATTELTLPTVACHVLFYRLLSVIPHKPCIWQDNLNQFKLTHGIYRTLEFTGHARQKFELKITQDLQYLRYQWQITGPETLDIFGPEAEESLEQQPNRAAVQSKADEWMLGLLLASTVRFLFTPSILGPDGIDVPEEHQQELYTFAQQHQLLQFTQTYLR